MEFGMPTRLLQPYQAEIRKAYMKLALQLHPDKNPGDESASTKFQTLQKIYSIVSDADK